MCGCTVYVWLHRLCVVAPFMCGCTVYGKKRPQRRRYYPRRKYRTQRGSRLFSSVGSSTVDRAIRQLNTPALIDRAAERFAAAGKDITNNAINSLIDIPKTRFLGAVSSVKQSITARKKKLLDDVKKKIAQAIA